MLTVPNDHLTTFSTLSKRQKIRKHSTVLDCTLQAHKVESFTQWAGVSVKCKKCGVTGMLYHDAKTAMVQRVLGGDAIRLLQSRLSHVKRIRPLPTS